MDRLRKAIVSSRGDEHERSYAAVTLGHYRDPRAIPAMRQAFLEQTNAQPAGVTRSRRRLRLFGLQPLIL